MTSILLSAYTPVLNTGNTAWMIMATILVLLMSIPGIALFYGGLVRQKNVLSVIMQTMLIVGVVSLLWVAIGYTWAFGTGFKESGSWAWFFMGGLDKAFLKGVTVNSVTSTGIPELTFAMFQCMFALITPALILGAFAERIKFKSYMVFTILWVIIAYFPMAHWVWGGGFLQEMGALDFAGGTVVHINAGISALIMCLMIGQRDDYKEGHPILPHNVTIVFMGTSFLWLGWFGFNSGAGLSANDVMTQALANTGIASCTAGLVWIVIEEIIHKKMTALGLMTGILTGLVGITPAAGFVDASAAFFIGITTPLICYFFVSFVKSRLGYDDSLDAFGCHGMGGVWGALMTGIFCTKTINDAGADGLLYGNPGQLIPQMTGIVTGIIVAVVMTTLIIKVLGIFMKVRATASEEAQGLDLIDHGERAYNKL